MLVTLSISRICDIMQESLLWPDMVSIASIIVASCAQQPCVTTCVRARMIGLDRWGCRARGRAHLFVDRSHRRSTRRHLGPDDVSNGGEHDEPHPAGRRDHVGKLDGAAGHRSERRLERASEAGGVGPNRIRNTDLVVVLGLVQQERLCPVVHRRAVRDEARVGFEPAFLSVPAACELMDAAAVRAHQDVAVGKLLGAHVSGPFHCTDGFSALTARLIFLYDVARKCVPLPPRNFLFQLANAFGGFRSEGLCYVGTAAFS